MKVVCGSRLANQSSQKESLRKSNGFASKPTESHSFLPLPPHIHILHNPYTSHLVVYILISLYITSNVGKPTLANTKFITIRLYLYTLLIIGYSCTFKPFLYTTNIY